MSLSNIRNQYVLIALIVILTNCTEQSIIQVTPETENYQDKSKSIESLERNYIPGEYIIILKENKLREVSEAAALRTSSLISSVLSTTGLSRNSVIAEYRYATKGFAAHLNSVQFNRLNEHPLVERVEKNEVFRIGGYVSYPIENPSNLSSESTFMSQTLDWGVGRVGGPHDGTGLTAWVLDTGVDLDHSDLNVDVTNSVNYVSGEGKDDLNGHGTHVSGIIGAKDNSINTVGVAAGATIVSVKVCDQNGDCFIDDIISGIDYVTANADYYDIVNMSIWYPPRPTLDSAVTNSVLSGLRYVLIAGNAKDDANDYSPGRVSDTNIWTVSAFDINDNFAVSFSCNSAYGSNYGNAPIDYSAPGNNILSLYKNGGTATLCGTSQAAPHLAGLLLVNGTTPSLVTTDGTVGNDPDSTPDDIAVYYPLEASISGPSSLDSGEQGTWTASYQHGLGTTSYQWYYQLNGSSTWVTAGSNSSSFNWTFTNQTSSSVSVKVRVKITRSYGPEEAIKDKTVIIQSGGCPPGVFVC